jgi:UDP-N-acetylmuramoylalanine--D-glutamate ligase
MIRRGVAVLASDDDKLITDLVDRLAGVRVCVAGLGVSGPPAARLLAARGARVTAVDARDDEQNRVAAADLSGQGVRVVIGPDPRLPGGTELVVTAPGWRPDAPLLQAAAAGGIPVIGDVELAWRLRPVLADGSRQQWLGVTGTNGKTTTVKMLAAMLQAAGHRTIAAGNIGTSVADAVSAADPYPVLAVELSSFQLYWSRTVAPMAAVILNIAGHHLDWHGDIAAYAAAKARIYAPGTMAVCNADDRRSCELAAAAQARASRPAARPVAFRLGEPGPGELGVAGGCLVDRAFAAGGRAGAGSASFPGSPGHAGGTPNRTGDGTVLASVSDVRPAAPHNVADALAAAALARAYGAPPAAVAAGLAAFRPEPHRIALVATVGGVDYVDDSKASNAHAAAASLAAFRSVVWIAGGLFRGARQDLDELVAAAAPRLRAAVLLGADREAFRHSLARHAPDVPVSEVPGTDTGTMDLVVARAASLAKPGDTVLLAPAAQSFDMFRSYPARGDAFAAAVARLPASAPGQSAPR